MTSKLDELDKVESTPLNQSEFDLKHVINDRLATHLREEEIKWYQRAKVKNLLEGDVNMKYFHLVANGKHRKMRIFQLDQEEAVIHDEEELKRYITKYYKNLFGPTSSPLVMMVESYRDDIPQVPNEENELLVAQFLEEEVREALFHMKHNIAPGLDGFLLSSIRSSG